MVKTTGSIYKGVLKKKKKKKNILLLDYKSKATSQYNLTVIAAIYHNMS